MTFKRKLDRSRTEDLFTRKDIRITPTQKNTSAVTDESKRKKTGKQTAELQLEANPCFFQSTQDLPPLHFIASQNNHNISSVVSNL